MILSSSVEEINNIKHFLTETVRIQLNIEKIVKSKLEKDPSVYHNGIIETVNKHNSSLMVGRWLVDVDRPISFSVVNFNSHKVTLKEGLVIGVYESMTCVAHYEKNQSKEQRVFLGCELKHPNKEEHKAAIESLEEESEVLLLMKQ